MRSTRWITAAVAFGAILSILVAAMLVLARQLRESRSEIEHIALEGRSIGASANPIYLRLLREPANSLRQSLRSLCRKVRLF